MNLDRCSPAALQKMINLSKKAAERFRIKWKDLEERSGDFWKVDAVMIGRVPMLFIVHEYTLFTLVRRKSQLHDPLAIVKRSLFHARGIVALQRLLLAKMEIEYSQAALMK